ncbi:kininogen-1 [Lithobates pipiens]
MKLLPILFLSFYCFLNAAVPVPDIGVDCDDSNIFKAVDEALRSYNNAKEDGNQFVLFRVADAKKRHDANGQIHYYIEYEIRESSCTVKSEHSWQDCQFQSNKPEWGKCSAHLLVNNEKKIQTVVSQNCSISKVPLEAHVTAIHHQCLGCPHPIDTNNEEILNYVHVAIEKMNRQGSHLYYFDLDQIVNATGQVVSGWDYNIHYLVRKTNCSKRDFKTKDSNECKLDKEGETGECELHVSIKPDGQVNDILLMCTSQDRVCLSCPSKVDPDDPELLTLLSQVIDEYNSNINVTKLHKLFRVTKAIKYGFDKQIHEVLFMMMPTNCSKPEYTILGDECNNVKDAYPLSCDATIHVTAKRINVHSAPECIEQAAILPRLYGLSPLRNSHRPHKRYENLNLFNSKIINQKSEGKKNNHQKEHKKEKKGKQDKKSLREHKHDHEDKSSSEEVVKIGNKANVNEATAAPHQVPDLSSAQSNMPDKQGVPKDVGETLMLELPAVPKCPGKIWQPLSLTTTAKGNR